MGTCYPIWRATISPPQTIDERGRERTCISRISRTTIRKQENLRNGAKRYIPVLATVATVDATGTYTTKSHDSRIAKKNHGKLVYCRSLSFSSTWTTTLTAPSATVASLRTSAPCGRGTRGRPRPRSPDRAAGRWTSGGSTPLEAAEEEGAGGDATAGRSTREMVRHEWEMSYRARLDT